MNGLRHKSGSTKFWYKGRLVKAMMATIPVCPRLFFQSKTMRYFRRWKLTKEEADQLEQEELNKKKE